MASIEDFIKEKMDEHLATGGDGGGFDGSDYEAVVDEEIMFWQMVIHGMANLRGHLRRLEEKVDLLLATSSAYTTTEEEGITVERCGKLVTMNVDDVPNPERDWVIILDFPVDEKSEVGSQESDVSHTG